MIDAVVAIRAEVRRLGVRVWVLLLLAWATATGVLTLALLWVGPRLRPKHARLQQIREDLAEILSLDDVTYPSLWRLELEEWVLLAQVSPLVLTLFFLMPRVFGRPIHQARGPLLRALAHVAVGVAIIAILSQILGPRPTIGVMFAGITLYNVWAYHMLGALLLCIRTNLLWSACVERSNPDTQARFRPAKLGAAMALMITAGFGVGVDVLLIPLPLGMAAMALAIPFAVLWTILAVSASASVLPGAGPDDFADAFDGDSP